jgi:hypothetical protein
MVASCSALEALLLGVDGTPVLDLDDESLVLREPSVCALVGSDTTGAVGTVYLTTRCARRFLQT